MSHGPVTADIIAISGLDGLAYESWRGEGNLGRMWSRDFLSKDLSSCRTMIYGYGSKTSSLGACTLIDYSRQLTEEIRKIGNSDELRRRPLFFIAHNFGGILLAHCLVQTMRTNEDDYSTIATLHRATYGILLFGIPDEGLIVNDIVKILSGPGDHAPRQEIRYRSHLPVSQLADCKHLVQNQKMDSESERLERCTTADSNSTLRLSDSTEKIRLGSDPVAMVKFNKNSDLGYTIALYKLKQFERNAAGVVAARFST
ncbi:hypothetical protein FLAG1_10658 [Fusarium langsethiae]|uniref:DUF676 domain-containing protein n=1 Tax=Fusarium langsethiae TaxID=179993 RepID=A0A0M9ENB0_FUSLA|nr:hypothetical protein FLAG1_10658 [Fusarium langsethiae]